MISTRPYLIRAFYEWIADNNCTPHIVVEADYPGVVVPHEYVENGQIVLNISMLAVQDLSLQNNAILFQARFGGNACDIYVPISAVTAIYALENGRGMVFSDEDEETDQPPPSTSGKTGSKTRASHLTVVK